MPADEMGRVSDRFVQVVGALDTLVALDASGRVYRYDCLSRVWQLVPETRVNG